MPIGFRDPSGGDSKWPMGSVGLSADRPRSIVVRVELLNAVHLIEKDQISG
jgi:hypothetical protein